MLNVVVTSLRIGHALVHLLMRVLRATDLGHRSNFLSRRDNVILLPREIINTIRRRFGAVSHVGLGEGEAVEVAREFNAIS